MKRFIQIISEIPRISETDLHISKVCDWVHTFHEEPLTKTGKLLFSYLIGTMGKHSYFAKQENKVLKHFVLLNPNRTPQPTPRKENLIYFSSACPGVHRNSTWYFGCFTHLHPFSPLPSFSFLFLHPFSPLPPSSFLILHPHSSSYILCPVPPSSFFILNPHSSSSFLIPLRHPHSSSSILITLSPSSFLFLHIHSSSSIIIPLRPSSSLFLHLHFSSSHLLPTCLAAFLPTSSPPIFLPFFPPPPNLYPYLPFFPPPPPTCLPTFLSSHLPFFPPSFLPISAPPVFLPSFLPTSSPPVFLLSFLPVPCCLLFPSLLNYFDIKGTVSRELRHRLLYIIQKLSL